ncbi:3-oxoacyl-[acyl-carrier-protein] reductase [Lentzea atacamensis]|uniref:3-oxoacyl-[acyl-carrier-protein] reductase n=1 Tax=Lentzea atacamensis TaxID=531938 RepID=A0A316HWS6_9PSEU|nr:3-oxoacyl-ACP reductase family protein [Lentzea atacamensis]PWK84855.1 3-oxoacyl-[acyl-carrier-protein] reductase [Lentzea atacamensis]
MKLDKQVAVVTGGSRGIGREICRALAAEGATVVVNHRRSATRAAEVAELIQAEGGQAEVIAADVAEPDEVDRMIAEVVERHGRVDVLVNNAGVTEDDLICRMSPDSWLAVMKVNFGGVFHCTQAVLPRLMAQGSGSIVNISSVMGERGWIGQANYAASKGAINAFTRCSAMEAARFGVRVNAVLPGFSPTEMVAGLLEGDRGKQILRQIPLRSFVEPEAIAQAVCFLAGPDAGLITGALVPVDGGALTALGLGRAR